MKFERQSKKDHRRMKREIDELANKERWAKLQGKVKKLKSEGLKFVACCLLGAAIGTACYFVI